MYGAKILPCVDSFGKREEWTPSRKDRIHTTRLCWSARSSERLPMDSSQACWGPYPLLVPPSSWSTSRSCMICLQITQTKSSTLEKPTVLAFTCRCGSNTSDLKREEQEKPTTSGSLARLDLENPFCQRC